MPIEAQLAKVVTDIIGQLRIRMGDRFDEVAAQAQINKEVSARCKDANIVVTSDSQKLLAIGKVLPKLALAVEHGAISEELAGALKALTIEKLSTEFVLHVFNDINAVGHSLELAKDVGSKAKEAADNLSKAILTDALERIRSQEIKIPLDRAISAQIRNIITISNLCTKNSIPLDDDVSEKISGLNAILNDTQVRKNFVLASKGGNALSSEFNNKLSTKEAELMRILHNSKSPNVVVTEQEKRFVANTLEGYIGDVDFNKRLTAVKKGKSKNYNIVQHEDVIDEIRYVTYKSKAVNSDLVGKTERTIEKIKSGEVLDPKDKLSPLEISRLEDIVKLKPKLDKYAELGVFTYSTKLNAIYEDVKKAKGVLDYLDEKAKEHYKGGDILMQNKVKAGIKPDFLWKLEIWLTETFVSKYQHAAPIYMNKEGKAAMSHIYEKYENGKMWPTDVMSAHFFRVDASKLVPTELQNSMREVYGDKWAEVLNKKFQDINQSIHEASHERFGKIENPTQRRFDAGYADYGLAGGHQRTTDRDFDKIRGAMMGEKTREDGHGYKISNEMICSEFTTKALVASIEQLNKEVTKDLKEHSLEVDGRAITQPISARERLSKVHPERLVKLLREAECVEMIGAPNIYKDIMDEHAKAQVKPAKRKAEKKPIDLMYDGLLECYSADISNHDKDVFVTKGYNHMTNYIKTRKIDLDLEHDPEASAHLKDRLGKVICCMGG